jgi:nucleoside-diphosphate-sugar epimerase
MRVLVIGGSGYVGRRVTEKLVERGDEVTVVSRGLLQPSILSSVESIQVDRKEYPRFEAAFTDRQFDAVIDNIAYDRADAESSVRAFRGRIGQYLYTSTMAVYDSSRMDRPVRESDAVLSHLLTPEEVANSAYHPNPARALTYTNGKRQVELVFQEASGEFAFTALRAPIVVGPDDRTQRIWWFVQRILDGGPFVYPSWGNGRVFQVVYADDLAGAFVTATGNPSALNREFNIAEPEVFSPETWIDGLAAALGRESRCVRIPEPLIRQAGLPDYTMPIAGRPFGHFLMDLSAAYYTLGFQPAPLQIWIGDTARGCAANPPNRDSQGYEHRSQEVALADRFEHLLAGAYQELTSSALA